MGTRNRVTSQGSHGVTGMLWDLEILCTTFNLLYTWHCLLGTLGLLLRTRGWTCTSFAFLGWVLFINVTRHNYHSVLDRGWCRVMGSRNVWLCCSCITRWGMDNILHTPTINNGLRGCGLSGGDIPYI